MMKSEYEGFFAEFYDILHSNLNDVKAYIELGKKYGPKILEIGSGTGRILLQMAREGYKITGLELNEDMISICKDKIEKETYEVRDKIKLVKGDMRDFSINEKFNLIIAPCNLVNHLVDSDSLERTLLCIKKHLLKDGVLIIDNSIPDLKFMVENNDKEEVFEFKHPISGRKIIDKFRAKYDFVNQIEKDSIALIEYDGEKKTREAVTEEILTYYFPRELRTILKFLDYEIFEERGSLLKGGAINENSSEMIFLCRLSNKSINI